MDRVYDETMELYAAPWLTWSHTTSSVVPVGVGPAVAHFEAQLPELILNEMRLEGINISETQLDRILADGRAPGVTSADTERILAFRRSAEMMLEWVRSGGPDMDLGLARHLNRSISTAEGVLEPGIIRGEGTVNGGGHVSGPGFRYSAPDSGEPLVEYLSRHLRVVNAVSDHVLRAALFAALFAYAQPFFDGNKRTGRLAMNYELLRYGFDGIIVPAEREADYVAAVAKMYRDGDATTYIGFLSSC